MTDSVTLVFDLGSLAQDAALRGDDRAAVIARAAAQWIMDAHAEMQAIEKRRAKDRSRKGSAESVESATSAESEQFRSSSSLDISREKETTTTPRASTAESVESIAPDVQQRFDMLRSRMGEDFPAADEFVRRRPYATWKGWLDAMISDIGPGSQYLPCDLARVCKDDAALERRIGSPRGLRSFLLNAREERITPAAGGSLPRPNSQQRALKALDGIQ